MENYNLNFSYLNLCELKLQFDEYTNKVIHNCLDNLKIAKKPNTNVSAKKPFIYFNQCQICGCQKGGNISSEEVITFNNNEEITESNSEFAVIYMKNENIYKSLQKEIYTRSMTEDEQIHSWVIDNQLNEEKTKEKLYLSQLVEFKKDYKYNFLQIIHTFLKQEYPISEQNKAINDLFNQPNCSHKEDILKAWFEKTFSRFFDFQPNFWGICEISEAKVEIDYILKLSDKFKQYILQSIPNFKDIGYFGVEVKYLDINSSSHKISEAFAQCIDYSFSKFNIDNNYITLPCVILLSNLSFDKEYSRIEQNYDERFRTFTFIEAQKNLARKFNVGEFKFETETNNLKLKTWSIKFLDQNFIRYVYKPSTITQSKNLSLGRKFGNRSAKSVQK